MPHIPRQWTESVVYLFASVDAAERGDRAGGTGFLISVTASHPELAGRIHTYVVTNSHVIRGGACVIRINTASGTQVIATDQDNWTHHAEGDDLALHPIQVPDTDFSVSINLELLLTPELAAHWDIGAGDEAFLMGRYIGLDERDRNTPVVRFGSVSLYPGVLSRPTTVAFKSRFLSRLDR